MKLEIKVFSSSCCLDVFVINGIKADSEDFVDQYDNEPGGYEYCGDMRADAIPVKPGILNKYKITLTEYKKIAQKVSELLSFGCCDLCS